MEGGVLGQKVGPLPLVAWVGLAGGAVAIALAVRAKMKNSSAAGGVNGAGIDMLSPSTAEAFGTLQQQQSDLTNALSALGAGGQQDTQAIMNQNERLTAASAKGTQAILDQNERLYAATATTLRQQSLNTLATPAQS